jgi:putative transposase
MARLPTPTPRLWRRPPPSLRRARKALSRSKKGSHRRRKKKQRLARLHARVRNLRNDAIHKATTDIARRFAVVAMEEPRVKNRTGSARGSLEQPGRNVKQQAGLNRALLDASLGELRRQLEYKMRFLGGRVVFVSPAYTSQRCSCRGSVNDPGSSETYSCAACGPRIDRDLNAARNILFAALSCREAENARRAGVRPGGVRASGRSASKREREQAFSHG